jgi:hypothetical protein
VSAITQLTIRRLKEAREELLIIKKDQLTYKGLEEWHGVHVDAFRQAHANGATLLINTMRRQMQGHQHHGNIDVLDEVRERLIGRLDWAISRVAGRGVASPAEGAFIAPGHPFNAFAEVGSVLGTAKTDVLIVDPYANEKVLIDFGLQIPEGVALRILAGEKSRKTALQPAAQRWARQFGSTRPLDVRVHSEPEALHERLILVDGSVAWTLTHSFNALAEQAHTSILRDDPKGAAAKIAVYEQLWQNAKPL